MRDSSESMPLTVIEDVSAQISRAREERWQLANGESASSRLDALAYRLELARTRLESGQSVSDDAFAGVVRWVTDWIPNVDDPLVAAVDRLERAFRCV